MNELILQFEAMKSVREHTIFVGKPHSSPKGERGYARRKQKQEKGGGMNHEELWPDAFCAPDVPDRDIIGAFMDESEKLDPDMCEQIRMSENCQRAIRQLEAERIKNASPEKAMEDEETVKALLDIKAKYDAKRNFVWEKGSRPKPQTSLTVPSPTPSHTATAPPAKIERGQLWTVSDHCKVWSGTRLVNWRINLLQRVIVIARGQTMPWGDSVIRIIPAVDLELCPDYLRSSEDILLESVESKDKYSSDEWIVHPRLEFPMSQAQLGNYLGELTSQSKTKLEKVLRALRDGDVNPPDFEEDPRYESHRRRYGKETFEEIRWVSVTADALRLAWEQESLN